MVFHAAHPPFNYLALILLPHSPSICRPNRRQPQKLARGVNWLKVLWYFDGALAFESVAGRQNRATLSIKLVLLHVKAIIEP
jgi:hypothetical protein